MYKTVPINERAYLELYLLDNLDNAGSQAENLPILLILPGGSYTYTSNREAQPIALSANTKAMHAAVLRYTVIPDKKDLTVDDLLAEVKAALDYIEEHSKEYRIDSKRIYLIGFSAGGHLASWASIKFYDRIDRVILAYPAVGFKALYEAAISRSDTREGEASDLSAYDLDLAELNQSMLKLFTNDPIDYIHKNVPPTFLFTTMDDRTVPAGNVMRYALKLYKYNVAIELHCYSLGGHGLSLATEASSIFEEQINDRVASWFDLAISWLKEY